MVEIRKLGWVGALIALAIFAAGFLAGGGFHHAMMPTATIAVLPPAVAKPPTPTPTSDLAKFAAEISEIRKELVEMNAALQRIAVLLRKR